MACTDVQTIQAGNGTKTQFSFDFPYIFKSEIHVYFWNVTTKEYDEKLTTDATYPWQITDANPTIVEFTGAAPPSPATPVDPGEPTVDNVKIRRITKVDDIRALFNPGSAIRSDDLNKNFEQLRYAIQEANCAGIPDDVDQYLKDYYWDRYDNTLYASDTWVSNDTKIATTAAMDARFQDEATETLTKAELAAVNNVIPDDDVALPTTGAVKDYVDHVVETDILVNSTGLTKTATGGQVTLGIAEGSVDLDRIKPADIITSSESNPNNDTTIATTAKIDDMIDAAITGDIAVDSTGLTVTNDGDGTITLGIGSNSVDFDRIKNDDIITKTEQDAGSPTAADTNIFTASAAAKRFDTLVQTGTPSESSYEVGKTWLQNDDDQTLKIWNGATWLDVASGGSFRTQDKVIYVDATGGDDSKTGHRISGPKLTIKGAINDINADISTSIKTAGSGYTNGTYQDVPLTGGTTGSGLTADITVSGGAVTAVTDISASTLEEYQIGDILSASDSNLGGGGGSGFELEVTGGGDGMTVIVAAGVYQEVAPIQIKRRNVSIIGMALRSTIVHPTVATEKPSNPGNSALFELNSGSFIQNLTLTGMQASNSGTNSIDSVLPDKQGWNFAFYNNSFITKSPYIQNCTNFSDSQIDNSDLRAHRPRGGSAGDLTSAPTGGGMLVDGSVPKTTSPLRSMVADSYTHVGLNGPGILVTNNGYAQCTSSYAFFNKYHIKALNGGQANLAASTTDFGEKALVADGKSTAAIFTATVNGAASSGDLTFDIDNVTAGTGWFGDDTKPASNMLVTVNNVTYPILSSTVITGGHRVTVSRPDPNNRSTNLGLNGAVADNAAVSFFLRSQIASSGHTMEYVGSGTDYNALPENGGVPVESAQITELNNGKIWTAITDHNGKFKIGGNQTDDPIFEVDQQLGFVTIPEGSIAFNLLSDTTPQLGGDLDANSNTITGLPTTPTASTEAVSKAYVDAQIAGIGGIDEVVEDTTPQLGGDLDVNGNEIVSTSNGNITINPNGTGDIVLDADVGIGTSSPSAKLHSVVASGEAIRASASGAAQHVWSRYVGGSGNPADLKVGVDSSAGGVYGVGGGGVVWNAGNGPLGFGTNDTERLRIDSSGNVGIGTSSPQSSLSVAGSIPNAPTTEGVHLGLTSNYAVMQLSGNTGGIIDFSEASVDNAGRIIYTHSTDAMQFSTGSSTKMTIDSSGQLGLGVTPASWQSSTKALQILSASLAVLNSKDPFLTNNAYWDGSNWKYHTTDAASSYYQLDGQHIYRRAASGTADANVTWSESMRIDSSGRVGIGDSSPSDKLSVSGGNIGIYNTGNSHGNLYFYKDGTAKAWVKYRGDNSNLIIGNVSDAVTINSSGNVGIGTSSPQRALQVGAHGSGNGEIALASSTSGNCSILMGDGATGTDLYRGYIQYNNSSDAMLFATSATERMRIGSAGQIGLGGANYGTSGQVLTSNGSSSAPTWQDAGGGAWNLITTVNASGASQADITGMGATYDQYCIIGRNVRGSVTDWLYSRWFDNGALITGNVYNVAWYTIVSNSPTTMSSNNETNYFRPGRLGSGTNDRSDFILWFNATDEDSTNTFNFQFSGQSSIGSVSRFNNGGGAVNTCFANISGVRFYPGSGTTTCTFQLYGIS